ncbi:hypothetical protein AB0P19_06935 [Microbacterium oleivorans]|uniref:hypothetical protein n=1 Tax=Microbacterium oleivorans TaxID=273677 RepID=UPI0033E02BE8
MSDINVTITGDKELVKKLNSFIGSDGLDLKRSMGASGLYLTRFFSGEVFASRGRVIGEPWAPLNPSYAAWKARVFPGRPPLVRSGEMMRGFKHEADKRSLGLYNTADHFDYHQEGRGVPQRVMMKIDQQRAARVVKYLVGDLTEQMQHRGLL